MGLAKDGRSITNDEDMTVSGSAICGAFSPMHQRPKDLFDGC